MSPLVKKYTSAAIGVLVLIAAVVIAVYVYQLGGPAEVLQLPPTLDTSSARSQNGFDLVSISRGHPDDSDFVMPSGAKMFLAAPQGSGDTVLWIAPPVLPPTNPLIASNVRVDDRLSSFYDVEVVSSAGDSFQIPWHYEGGCLEGGGVPCSSTRTSAAAPQLIAAVIPSGYPVETKYFDVSISDPYGHKAHWRISHLPQMECSCDDVSSSSFSFNGVSFALSAVRSAGRNGSWPIVKLTMTVQPIPEDLPHEWGLFERGDSEPTLTWQPRKLPWQETTFDRSNQRALNVYWIFSRIKSYSGVFSTIASPYVRENDRAVFHGVLVQYVTRSDIVHIKRAKVDAIRAGEGGIYRTTYCLHLGKSQELISGSGLTFQLPAQHMSAKKYVAMSPDCLNLYWHLSPVTPGTSSETAAYLPDSPLCKEYSRPVAVWFEAFANGIPLGVCTGLPAKGDKSALATLVRIQAPYGLPETINDLKIVVHQRVDLRRIPVTLTARIVDTN